MEELHPSTPAQTAAPVAWLVAILLWLVTVGLYWPVTHNDFIYFDDDHYVLANEHVRQGLSAASIGWAFTHTVGGNWHPLTMLSHILDCQMYGLHPGGHHLTSALLHAVNTVLVFFLLRRLTGACWRSALVAALFACHPLHVESVAWLAERKDVLSTCFGLASLLFYVGYPRSGLGARPFYRSRRYWLAWLCFALGLMCKPMLVTWPFVLLLLDYWPLQRLTRGAIWRRIVEKIPFLVLTLAFCVATFLAQRRGMSTLAHMTIGYRCENALLAYAGYLEKMFWPAGLAIYYPLPEHLLLGPPVLSGVVLAGITVLAWVLRQRFPFVLLGWFWYLGTIIPVIGLVQVGGQAMADRYTYIPSLGIFVAVIWGLYELSQGWSGRAVVRGLASATVLLLCLVGTRRQLAYWQNTETLFHRDLQVAADNEIARNCLGAALMAQHQTNAAMVEFTAAVRLSPRYVPALENQGRILAARNDRAAAIDKFQDALRVAPRDVIALNALGNLHALNGQTNEAAREFQEALRLQPDYADARFNFANFLLRQGRPDAAQGELEVLVRLAPNDAEAHYRLGILLAKAGRADEAMVQFQEATRRDNGFAEAHNNLGILLAAQAHGDAAVDEFQEAIRLQPDYRDAHYNLANELFKAGRFAAAIPQFRAVTQLSPDFVPAHYYLGVALAKQGQADAAARELREAIRLKPDNAPPHNRLGVVLGDQGRLDEAIGEFREALRLKPDYAEASNNLARAIEIQRSHAP